MFFNIFSSGSGLGNQFIDSHNSLRVITQSSEIETLEQAQTYWVHKFGNKTLKLIVTSGKDKKGMPKKIAIKVFFDKKNNHAFTEDEHKTGKNELRTFNLQRAKAIDKIIPTIEAPHVRLKHHGADLLFERLLYGYHFTVVLQWQPFQEYYRFQSAHFQTAEQVSLLLKNKDTRKGEGLL